MGVSSAGGAAPKPVQGAVNIDQTAQSRSQVKETAKGLSEVMTNVKELSQELKNQQSFKTTNKESNSKLDTQTNKALDQLKQQAEAQQKQVQSQSQSQQTQMGNQKDAQVVAEAMAGLMMEEELGETDELQKSLEEKMDVLMQKAEELQDVELDNSDNNFELQQMLKNMEKFKGLKRREGQLNKQLEDLEINLKEQETKEELNKLPVDETTKKMREELRINYDMQEQQNQQQHNQSKDSDDDDDNDSDSNESPSNQQYEAY